MGNEQTCMTKISNQILITMQEKLKNIKNKCLLYIRCLKNELFMLIMTKNDDISIIIHEKSSKLNFNHSKLLKIRI